MKTLVIVCSGDNMVLHHEALRNAVEAVEKVNGHGSVYRAYVQGEPNPAPRESFA